MYLFNTDSPGGCGSPSSEALASKTAWHPEWRRSHGQRVERGKARGEEADTRRVGTGPNYSPSPTLCTIQCHTSLTWVFFHLRKNKKSHISCTQLLTKTSELSGSPATSTEMALNKLSGLLEQPLSLMETGKKPLLSWAVMLRPAVLFPPFPSFLLTDKVQAGLGPCTYHHLAAGSPHWPIRPR